jgi:two-component system cell cycle sensor histidine kinase/response regulator CckA
MKMNSVNFSQTSTPTGLGLSTIYGIIKQNKGFINLYSEPGKGTTFRIYIPRHIDRSETRKPEKRITNIAKGHENILPVEDEPSLLNIYRAMLEKLGYCVLSAGRPSEAISLAEEYAGEIDLVLTDVVMPEMNGHQLCKRLSALNPNLKKLFMSGYTSNVIGHHGALEEGVCFIPKPFSLKDLSFRIRKALQG